MFHKEDSTLDLLGQYSQKNNQPDDPKNESGNDMYRELGQFIKKTDKKQSSRTFGIPNFIWYFAMIAMCFYLFREVDFSQINNVPEAISTIQKTVNEKMLELQHMIDTASQNANTKKDQN